MDLNNNLGTITFDSNDNIISFSGIGAQRTADVKELGVLTLKEDQSLVVDINNEDMKAYMYKKDGIILVVYMSTVERDASPSVSGH